MEKTVAGTLSSACGLQTDEIASPTLLDAQGLHGLDGGGAVSGDETGAEGAGDAEEEAQAGVKQDASKDEADDADACRAEGHADTNLASALSDGVGGYAVQADGGEGEGEEAEDDGEAAISFS